MSHFRSASNACRSILLIWSLADAHDFRGFLLRVLPHIAQNDQIPLLESEGA